MKKLSKPEAQNYIKEFFSNIQEKEPKDIKKMLRITMSQNIRLKEKKKLFCRKCLTIFTSKNSQIRIKKGYKITRCFKCGTIKKLKLSTFS